MRMGNVGLLLFVLVAAGAVGFLAGRSTAPSGEAVPDSGPAPEREQRPREAAAPADAPDLARYVTEGPPLRIEPGDGVVTGTVRTEQGVPLEGVRIIGNSRRREHSAPPPGEVPAEPDLEDAVRDLILDHQHRRATRVEARSGPDGTFRLTGLQVANYTVRAYRRGYRIWTRTWQVRPGATLEFTARAVSLLPLVVLAPDGTEVAEAMVSAKMMPDGGGQSGAPWSPARRTMELVPGTYAVSATAKGGEWKSDAVDVTLESGRQPAKITLQLEAVPGVRGRILFPKGEAARYLTVYAVRWDSDDLPSVDSLRRMGRRVDPWISGQQAYLFSDLEPGDWLVALLEDRGIAVSARVTIGNAMVVRDLQVPLPDPAEYVVVTVVGPEGKPVTAASISTGIRHGNGRSSGGSQPVKLAPGRYRVRHHDAGDAEGRDDLVYYLRVSARGLGEQEVVYDPASAQALTVTFEAPATLLLRVPNAPPGWLGDRLSVGLLVKPRRGSSTSTGTKVVDATTMEAGPITPGEYEVSLYLRLGDHTSVPVSETTLVLRAGSNTHAMSLPPLYRTQIVLPDDKGGNGVRISPVAISSSHWSLRLTAKNGRVEVPELPAGTYRARRSGGSGRAQMDFTLPGPAVVPFAATKLNAALLRIKDPEGVLGQIGFRDGDVIIGAHGKLFESEIQLSMAIMGGRMSEAVKLIVLRGGSRIDLTVNLKKLYETKDKNTLGGDLDIVARPK